MKNLVFFYRRRNRKNVLQSMQWKSITGATGADRDDLLELLGSGDYVQTIAFVPANMVKGGDKDD